MVAIEDLVDAWQKWKDAVDEVAESVGVTEDDIIDKTGELEDASNDLKDTIVSDVIPAIMNEIEAVRQEVIAFNNAKTALENLKSKYEDFIRTLQIAEGQAKKTSDAVNHSSPSTGTLTSNKGGSSGGGSGSGGNKGGGPGTNPDPVKKKVVWVRYDVRSSEVSGTYSGTSDYEIYVQRLVEKARSKKVKGSWTAYSIYSDKSEKKVASGTFDFAPKTSFKTGGAIHGGTLAWQMGSQKTGGYTGAWSSDEGRIGILHQKELVLNAADTRNMLKAVKVTREMAPSLKAIENEMDFKVLRNMSMSNVANLNIPETRGELQQSVRIEASFPNVSNSNEIETAFNNLINEAAQFAKRR